MLPVTGSRLVASVLQAGESVLIPACLAAYLGTRAEAVAQYGSLKGMGTAAYLFSVLGAGGTFRSADAGRLPVPTPPGIPLPCAALCGLPWG